VHKEKAEGQRELARPRNEIHPPLIALGYGPARGVKMCQSPRKEHGDGRRQSLLDGDGERGNGSEYSGVKG